MKMIYEEEVDFETRLNSDLTRKEVLDNLKSVIKNIEKGEEKIISYNVVTQK